MTIGFAAVPFAFIAVEVPLAVGAMALERATAPPPGLVTLTPGLSVTVNKGGPVVGPPKVMLVLKVPVQHGAGLGSSECPWVGYWGASLRQRWLRYGQGQGRQRRGRHKPKFSTLNNVGPHGSPPLRSHPALTRQRVACSCAEFRQISYT